MRSLVVLFAVPVVGSIVELGIASNTAPFPSVQAAAASGNGNSNAVIAELDAAYSSVLAEASAQLGGLLGRASFISEPVVGVTLIKGNVDISAGVAAAHSIAAKLNAQDNALVAAGKRELSELAKVVISEYARHGRRSFLQGSRELSVKLTADPNYKTVGSILASMGSADIAREEAIRSHLLNLELKLVQALNSVAKVALSGR